VSNFIWQQESDWQILFASRIWAPNQQFFFVGIIWNYAKKISREKQGVSDSDFRFWLCVIPIIGIQCTFSSEAYNTQPPLQHNTIIRGHLQNFVKIQSGISNYCTNYTVMGYYNVPWYGLLKKKVFAASKIIEMQWLSHSYAGLDINLKLFSSAEVSHHKSLILLKEHFTMYKNYPA